jgi:tryptophan synthase alpha chain
VEEADKYLSVMRENNLDTVFLAAPTSTERRMKLVAQYSSGFIYLVSRTGVTGEQTSVSDLAGPLVKAMREISDLPLAVGFGIATADHAEQVGALADGVIVGSAIVRVVEKYGASPELESRLEALARDLKSGLMKVKKK